MLGALFCLWILGKVELTASFFIINIGLNIALSLSARGIDWGAHLGGFTAGLLACALIDLVERGNRHLFACKFPEGLKLNLLLLAAVAVLAALASPAPFSPRGIAVAGVACLLALGVVAKVVDLLLGLRHGLAFAAGLLAVVNALVALALAALALADRMAAPVCTAIAGAPALAAVCAHPGLVPVGAAVIALAASLALSARSIGKGVGDLGFVAHGLRGERRRHSGL